MTKIKKFKELCVGDLVYYFENNHIELLKVNSLSSTSDEKRIVVDFDRELAIVDKEKKVSYCKRQPEVLVSTDVDLLKIAISKHCDNKIGRLRSDIRELEEFKETLAKQQTYE